MRWMLVLLLAVVMGMAGCGGGGGGTATPNVPATTSFTPAMISGKTFTDSAGSFLTFNSNGTFLKSNNSTPNMTWSINTSGQLVVVAGSSTGTATLLSGSLAKGLNYSMLNSDGSTNAGTLTVSTTTGFTPAMISGKTFTDSAGSFLTFNSNGTFLKSNNSTPNMTWSIHSGQIVLIAGNNAEILTLLSGSLAKGLYYSDLHADGSTSTGTLTLK